jgi:hypothetical protein
VRRRATVLIALAFISGCSFIGVRGPGSRGVECTTNRTAPVVDTVATAGAIIGITSSLIKKSNHCNEDPGGEPHFCVYGLIAGTFVLAGIPYALSAIYGHSTVSSCKRFRAKHDATYLR